MLGTGVLLRRRRRTRRESVQHNRAFLRSLRDNSDPFSAPESVFIGRYRLTKEMTRALVCEIRPYVKETQTFTSIPLEIKVLCSLHFYGHGSDQKSVASDVYLGLSQPSVSRAITEVTEALNNENVLCNWIVFPQTMHERNAIIERNYEKFGIPGVLGYVDGVHIMIVAPTEREEVYINRKSKHSLNAQIACDSDLFILNILAKYPGSCHDSFIWRNSALKSKMQQLYADGERCWLLGDSGYPSECWLLTPVLNAEPDSPAAHYTELHIRARNCVERCIGVLKSRFRCLQGHRVLEYTPEKTGQIVNACAVLHNICVRARIEHPNVYNDIAAITGQDNIFLNNINEEGYNEAIRVREEVIDRLV